ncbi:MAG: endonuclease/exonuclease/phosphatase family protein [Bradymonadia bacterium]|jgi:hypothetical protein
MSRLRTFFVTLLMMLLAMVVVSCVDDTTRKEKVGEILLTGANNLIVSEDGDTAVFGLQLNIMPRKAVTISIESTNTEEGTVEPQEVVFNALTYHKERKITITGVDDNVLDGPQSFKIKLTIAKSEDIRFLEGSSVEVSVINNDNDGDPAQGEAGVWLSETSVTTSELGSPKELRVRLKSKPTNSVNIFVFNEDETEGLVLPKSLLFEPETWNVEQIVTITPINDGEDDGDMPYTIWLQMHSSADPQYSKLDDIQISVLNLDAANSGQAGFAILPLELTTYEEGEAEYFDVALNSKPTADVKIELISSDTTEGVVSPKELIFTPDNWFEFQEVTVTPVSDDEQDLEVLYSIILKAAQSADPNYNGLDPLDVMVTNIDKPSGEAGVIVEPTSGLETDEDGKSDSFTVVLKNRPRADVHIPVSSSDDTEGEVSKDRLIFTPDTWNLHQTVHVTGLDDDIPDSDVQYTIHIGPTFSDDPLYNQLPASTVSVINRDNEAPTEDVSIIVKTPNSLVTTEAGSSVRFTVQLVGAPTSDVHVELIVTDTSEGEVSPTTLTFTPQNFNVTQTVTITGKNDNEIDGDQSYELKFKVTSSDTRYNEYEITPLVITNVDDDAITGQTAQIRIMAANTTSGNKQSYDPGHGIRIFQGIKPDIVLIQEFNYFNGTLRQMVDKSFGPDFYYTCGKGQIPNGVISRYPIIKHGAWSSDVVSNRDWDWAVIDIPGPRDLLVVSVHLHTSKNAKEMDPLMRHIDAKIKEGNYYAVIGGDFNTSTRATVTSKMSGIFRTSGPYPKGTDNLEGTNAKRRKPYDWVLASHDWDKFEVPLVIGTNTLSSGLVFDSRTYTPLDEVYPVQKSDSGASNMQHMAVVRDFAYTY